MKEVTVTTSAYSVAETVGILKRELNKRGIHLFAEIDHAAGAREAGLVLDDEVLLVFGSPAVGTVLMQSNPAAGLDLPLRLVVWRGADRTFVAYHDPHLLAGTFGLTGAEAVLDKLAALLAALAATASSD